MVETERLFGLAALAVTAAVHPQHIQLLNFIVR
jgi:hypothetical protein